MLYMLFCPCVKVTKTTEINFCEGRGWGRRDSQLELNWEERKKGGRE